MNSINNRRNLLENERGLASFLVTAIMMIIVTLIVLGFAQVSRRDESESLDRELSTQAFYAAESGVNDAINAIENFEIQNSGSATIISPPTKTDCGNDSNYTFNSQLSSNVSYTCLLIDPEPTSLVYTSTTDKAINIQDAAADNLKSITIAWQDSAGGASFNGCPAAGTFPTQWNVNNDCDADVLQVDIVPVNALTNTSSPQTALEQQTFTLFLAPQNSQSGGTVAYPSPPITTNNGPVVGGSCQNGNGCSVIVNNLSQNQYFVRIMAMYGTPQDITITAADDVSSQTQFINGQAVIDSTGKAQDILRRIQVRKSLNGLDNAVSFPNYAVQTTDSLCKRFYITPIDGTANFNGNPVPGAPNVASSDAGCSLTLSP